MDDHLKRIDKLMEILDSMPAYYREDRLKKLLESDKGKDLDKSITLGACAGTSIQDLLMFSAAPQQKTLEAVTEKYPIGEYKGITIYIDPMMRWGDLRILDSNNGEIIDLADHGFTTSNLI